MNLTAKASLAACCLWLLALSPARSQTVINEVLFNPPRQDAPNAYTELRGPSNALLPKHTYFLAIAGDTNANPGTIRNLFDLSNQPLGGNGYLVLLQKEHSFVVHSNAAKLANTGSGLGFGSGSSSSIDHRGAGGQTDLEHASVTFLLVQTTNQPGVGADLDVDNDGTLDANLTGGWTVWDSVGVLSSRGAGDIAYGAINFRRNTAPGSGAVASGTIVPVPFTASYVARTGNTLGSAAADWVAGDDLTGVAPTFALNSAALTAPVIFAGDPLDHIGAPNFGAPPQPGVVVRVSNGATEVSENGITGSYALALNTFPTGVITIQVSCGPQLEVNVGDGTGYGPVRDLSLSNTVSCLISVRALDDNAVEALQHRSFITNRVVATLDSLNYSLNTPVPSVPVEITDNDIALLSEIKANPPGTTDGPNEFVELRGAPGALLKDVYLLAVEGNSPADPGEVTFVADLTGVCFGTNGLLAVLATNHPYAIAAGTTVLTMPELGAPEGALGNDSLSFLLVSSRTPIHPGDDLDRGDNGIPEGLPDTATILDAVGWLDGDSGDLVYGGVVLPPAPFTPDAVTRIPGNFAPRSANAWIYGELVATNGDSLAYDPTQVSRGFPVGTWLTPGAPNNTAPSTSPITPVSGVIGDPWNPSVAFTANDTEVAPSNLTVTVSSSNPSVVPNARLTLASLGAGAYSLSLEPVGVGYSTISIFISEGSVTGLVTFPYAASAPGRPGGIWHQGACDASTAIALDSSYMIIGDDENQTLRLYPRQRSSLPFATYDMTAFLQLPDVEAGKVREVDVEAATRVGNRIYWMGSHSHANIGETRTNRTRLWATDLGESGPNRTLTYIGRYDYFKVDLITWDTRNLHGKGTNYFGIEASDAEGVQPKAPDGSGFSIEGLAMMPNTTNGAYVAFRAPIVPAFQRDYALIVPVLNFAQLAVSGGPPGSTIFGPPIEVDLFGRGIRSIEGNAQGYLIIGGPAATLPGDYPRDFRLYTWSGNPSDAPQQRDADLSGLNPEAIVELPPQPWTPASQVQLVSDNGLNAFYGDGVPAKWLPEANFKKNRSDLVALGPVVEPGPVITSVSLKNTQISVQWRAIKGAAYRLQTAVNLANPSWSDVPGDVVASGPWAEKDLPARQLEQFFRVRLVR